MYLEGPEYVPLLRRSFGLWRDLEAETGDVLLTMTGGLMIGPPHGKVVAGALGTARVHDLDHEMLDADEMARRYPQHRLNPAMWRYTRMRPGSCTRKPRFLRL